MLLSPNDIHVWSTSLVVSPAYEQTGLTWLSEDERLRAERFRYPLHRGRFIAARAGLRRILGVYLDCSPEAVNFTYNEHGKPFLASPAQSHWQFNVAHSETLAVYAIANDQLLGIDVEAMQDTYHFALAQRFFSAAECHALEALPADRRAVGFYQLWSRKEALLKAVGTGLILPLSNFSVTLSERAQQVTILNKEWTVAPLSVHKNYQSALACERLPQKLTYWELLADRFQMLTHTTY